MRNPENSFNPCVTFSNKLFSVAPFAPTNSQLSLNPSEPMLALPSSVISFFASLSNLFKWVDGFSWQFHPFFPLLSGEGHTLWQVHQKMRSTRWIQPRGCSGKWWEVSPLETENKLNLINSLLRQICWIDWTPTRTAAVHVKVAGVCDFSCFTCWK